MLYVFDIDGTLIRGHLSTLPCGECRGTGVRHPIIDIGTEGGLAVAASMLTPARCAACKGKGKLFGPPKPYEVVEVLPGVRAKLAALVDEHRGRSPGVSFALVTNQGGVALGYQWEWQVWQKIAKVGTALSFFYGAPHSIHVAFGHERAFDPRFRTPAMLALRKPQPGMLYEAMDQHRAIPEETVFVGDLATDKQAAEAAGVRFEWAWDFFGFAREED